jgi:hypothetical protein
VLALDRVLGHPRSNAASTLSTRRTNFKSY